jgi:hypothetical protein
MTWHYIFSKYPAHANNINNLLDALGQQLLKISYAMFRSVIGTWLPVALIFLASWAA